MTYTQTSPCFHLVEHNIFIRNFLTHDPQLSLMDGCDLSVHHFVSLFHTPLHIQTSTFYSCSYIKIVATSKLHLHISTIVEPLVTFMLWFFCTRQWGALCLTSWCTQCQRKCTRKGLAIQAQAKSWSTRSSLAWKCCQCCILKWGKLAMLLSKVFCSVASLFLNFHCDFHVTMRNDANVATKISKYTQMCRYF